MNLLNDVKAATPRRRSCLRRDPCRVAKRKTMGRIELEMSEPTICQWLLAGACRRAPPRIRTCAPEQPPDRELRCLRGASGTSVCTVIFCGGRTGFVPLLTCPDPAYRVERDRLRQRTRLELLAVGELSVGEYCRGVPGVGWLCGRAEGSETSGRSAVDSEL